MSFTAPVADQRQTLNAVVRIGELEGGPDPQTIDAVLEGAAALAEGAPLPLFATDMEGEGIVEPVLRFRAMTEGESVVEDYVAMRLTLRTHPVALLRPWLDAA